MGAPPSQTSLGWNYIPLIRELQRRVVVLCGLERATLPDADGNIASATKLYYKMELNRFSI